MADVNLELMRLFPSPDELPGAVKRDDVLDLVRRVLESSRAGIDEIVERSGKVLTEDELLRLGQLAEKLGGFATEASEYSPPDMLDN